MKNYKYAVINCAEAIKDFHERAKKWDDNYIRFMKVMVDFELDCREGNKTFVRDVEDFYNKSVVVGSDQAEWRIAQ